MLSPADLMGAAGGSVSLSLPAVRESVPEARHAMFDLARACGSDLDGVAVAVSEAVGNAVVHGYRDGRPGEVRVEGFREGSELVVTVDDDGVGMLPNPASEGLGLGVVLMGAMASAVQYETSDPGVRVTMRFRRVDGAAPAADSASALTSTGTGESSAGRVQAAEDRWFARGRAAGGQPLSHRPR